MSWADIRREIRFHTTQYDLNKTVVLLSEKWKKSFHTTQYDLNKKQEKKQGKRQQFPYYIVRFKQAAVRKAAAQKIGFHTTQYDLNINYIPHFSKKMKSFHTTQYDLNTASDGRYHQHIHLFPYYIVRFKLFRKGKMIFFGSIVSILHSTI